MATERRSKAATSRRLGAFCLVVLCSCGTSLTGTAAELQFATATNSCAPTDAPAITITLSARPLDVAQQADPPFLTVSVWTGLGELAGRSFRIGQGSNDGFGEYYAIRDAQAGPVTGTIVVIGVARDSSIIGSLDVLLRDGSRFVHQFSAPWRPTRTRCG